MKDDASSRREPLPRLLSFASAAFLVLALSFAIAWPLWILATREKALFSIGVLALCCAAALFFVARSILRRLTRRGTRARRLP